MTKYNVFTKQSKHTDLRLVRVQMIRICFKEIQNLLHHTELPELIIAGTEKAKF